MSLLFLLSELPNTSTDTLMATLGNLQAAQTNKVLTDFNETEYLTLTLKPLLYILYTTLTH